MAEAGNFFSRWSQRKALVARGVALDEPVEVPVLLPVPATVRPSHDKSADRLPPSGAPGTPGSSGAVTGVASDPVAVPAALPAAPEPPPLTLADAQALTTESDFKPFMARSVTPEVKNAAMKKLFTDPHYNVMDRLDIYIDDYSQPDPLPESLLRQMTSAKFLNLFAPEDNEPPFGQPAQPAQPDEPVPTGEDANTPAGPNLPESDLPPAILQPLNPDDTHAHADLRLQPHDAAVHPPVGSPTGPSGQ